MLDMEVRRMFKKWKLYEREWLFYTTICYESPIIKIERIYPREDKNQIYDLIFNLYFEYEWNWQELSARQLAKLSWVSHQTMNNMLIKIKREIAPQLEWYRIQ